MMRNRREFFRKSLLGAGLLVSSQAGGGQMSAPMSTTGDRKAGGDPIYAGQPFLPVETPDIPNLPWKMDNGVKVFHLVAEPVKRQIHPDKTIDVWGYNGTSPGPTIQILQEDHVRIIVDNHLPEATSVHWHGLEIPTGMDGVPGLTQLPIPPGGRSIYEFTLHQEGTYFYHSHMAMQEMLGMLGAFILHPKKPHQPRVDKDFVIMLQEYSVLPNNSVPNTMSMEFNWLVFNGKAGPAITPMITRLGDRVRIRLINMGMDHHPVHLHGNTFWVTGTEAGRAPESTWRPENTVLVGVAQARDIEFDAKYPGDWMLHCHLPHHMMNQMVSPVGPMTRLGTGMPVEISPDANHVPGFPQDAYMEGAGMAMDKSVEKPENYGLQPWWSGFMQGMMTLVRVLPPDEYAKIMAMIRTKRLQPMPGMPGGWNPRGTSNPHP